MAKVVIEETLWHVFAESKSQDARYHAWLGLMCHQLSEVSAAVLLWENTQQQAYLPAAVWPDSQQDLSDLSAVVELAITKRKGKVRTANQQIHVAYPVEIGERIIAVLVVVAKPRPQAEIDQLLRQIHWGSAWVHDIFFRNELDGVTQKNQRIGSVMETLAIVLRQASMQQVLFDLVNRLGADIKCTRAAIGLVEKQRVRVAALSHAAWFEKNTDIMKRYAAAMEETQDLDEQIRFHYQPRDNDDNLQQIYPQHGLLAKESGAHFILSLPLKYQNKMVAVLLLERDQNLPLSSMQMDWLAALSGLLPAVIQQKKQAERNLWRHFLDSWQMLMTRLLGPGFLVWKFCAFVALVVILVFAFVDIDYRVNARTVLEGEVQLTVAAPFEGFIRESQVRAGDLVSKGQLLCRLDDRDLLLEQHKWQSEKVQYSRQLREAMAEHDMSKIKVLGAQVKQAEAQLALVSDQLQRINILSPIDGLVISGDLSQLIGSPVDKGDSLFEVAPLDSYRVIMQVSEQDMMHIAEGQLGKLIIAGVVEQPVDLELTKITPIAIAEDGENFYRVEAKLDSAPAYFRPGMEGVGKISTGEQPLWWVLTHQLRAWLRISLWKWMP